MSGYFSEFLVVQDSASLELLLTNESTSWQAREVLNTLDKKNYFNAKLLGKNKRLLGFYLARQVADFSELLFVVVDSECRGQGLGCELLEVLKKQAFKKGLGSIELEVKASNTAARHMYEKAGFKICGERVDYYLNDNDQRENAVLYRLELV